MYLQHRDRLPKTGIHTIETLADLPWRGDAARLKAICGEDIR